MSKERFAEHTHTCAVCGRPHKQPRSASSFFKELPLHVNARASSSIKLLLRKPGIIIRISLSGQELPEAPFCFCFCFCFPIQPFVTHLFIFYLLTTAFIYAFIQSYYFSLNLWIRAFLEKLTVSQPVNKLTTPLKPDVSSPCLQKPTTTPYPELHMPLSTF